MPAPEGRCHLCGKVGKLSFEHVPPKAAFNSEAVRATSIEGAFDLRYEGKLKGYVSQKGAGAHTLCERCNSITGKWYGTEFARWCYQGADVLVRSDFKPRLMYLHYIFPLRVLKQVFTMCFSVNSSTWREKVPDLEAFVLDRDRRWLSPIYRVFVYYKVEGVLRRIGNQMAYINLNEGPVARQVVEISHPPFGYVVTFDGFRPSEPRLFEITHFQRYEYQELEVAPLYLEVLPTHLGVPLDYRTEEEIEEGAGR